MTISEKISILKIKRKSEIDKLISDLKKYDITFSDQDGKYDNVVFTRNGIDKKIVHYQFYRFSGISVLYIDVPKSEGKTSKKQKAKEMIINFIPMSDEFFYQVYLKRNILKHFEL